MRWAGYCRISLDRTGEGEKVADQKGLVARLIELEDPAAEVSWYTDNDISAWSGVERPGYDALVRDAARGQYDRVAAKETERLWRSVADQEGFKVAVSGTALTEVVTLTQRFKLDDVDDTFTLTLLAALGARESAKTSQRMKNRQALKAERGEHHGGRRGFGHTASRDGLVESEAEMIRDATARVLRDESMRSIVVEWNRAGVLTSMGVPWRVDGLRDLLQQPRSRWHPGASREALRRFVARDHHPRGTRTVDGAVRVAPTWTERIYTHGEKEPPVRDAPLSEVQPHHDRVPEPLLLSGTGEWRVCGATVRIAHADQAVTDKFLAYLDSPRFAKAMERG